MRRAGDGLRSSGATKAEQQIITQACSSIMSMYTGISVSQLRSESTGDCDEHSRDV